MSAQTPPNANGLHPLALLGMFLIAAPLCIAAFTPQLPILVAILIGTVLGVPVFFWAMRIQSRSTPDQPQSKPFLPSKTEAWGMLALLTYFIAILAPVGAIVPLMLLIPAGDGWGIVSLRILVVCAWMTGFWAWLNFASKAGPRFFRGKIPDECLDGFKMASPPSKQLSVKETAINNWQLLLVTLVAIVIFWGLINIDNPLLELKDGPRRARSLARMLTWCRGNPNTARSSALLVGIGALCIYAYKIGQAYRRTRRATTNSVGAASVDVTSHPNQKIASVKLTRAT